MVLTIDGFNRKEVLQYLMWRGSEIPEEIEEMIDSCMEETLQSIRPQFTWRLFSVEHNDTFSLKEAGLELPGSDIRRLLEDCDRCVLMAVTLGSGMDRLILRSKGRNLSRSVVLDSCGSAAVEAACEQAQKEILRQLGGECYLTDRFSPGYGDLPLEFQKQMIELLDTPRQIGLTLSESCMMAPGKSVTAIIGIADKPQKKRFRGCAYCSMFESCAFRKGKTYCGRA